jgi:hypothetical protein
MDTVIIDSILSDYRALEIVFMVGAYFSIVALLAILLIWGVRVDYRNSEKNMD